MMVRVRFIRRTVYDTFGPGKGPVYEADSVHELSQDEANRWFRRGLAEPAPAPEPIPEPEPESVAREESAPVVEAVADQAEPADTPPEQATTDQPVAPTRHRHR